MGGVHSEKSGDYKIRDIASLVAIINFVLVVLGGVFGYWNFTRVLDLHGRAIEQVRIRAKENERELDRKGPLIDECHEALRICCPRGIR